MLTPDRAKEVINKQKEFPYWGAYSKFMSQLELDHVDYVFKNAASGSVSFASIVHSIAKEKDVPLKNGVHPYKETQG